MVTLEGPQYGYGYAGAYDLDKRPRIGDLGYV
jgi:hypothetical protein